MDKVEQIKQLKEENKRLKTELEDKCKECENDSMLKYADLQIDYDKAEDYIELLEQCLDVKEKLNEYLRKESEELRNKLRIYENDNPIGKLHRIENLIINNDNYFTEDILNIIRGRNEKAETNI